MEELLMLPDLLNYHQNYKNNQIHYEKENIRIP
jgi:hypothetical protein